MNSYPHKPVHIRQNEQSSLYGEAQEYPGVHQPGAPYMQDSPYSPYLPAPAAPASSGSGLLSKIDFNQIKATIDRLGGVDGILATVSKVQKVMQTMQQFAPMLKLLIPKLGAKSADSDEEFDDLPRRRRRRRSARGRSRYGGRRGYARNDGYRRRAGRSGAYIPPVRRPSRAPGRRRRRP